MNKRMGVMAAIVIVILMLAGVGVCMVWGKERGSNMEQETITAMYIPFGQGGHIFVGDQAGVFTATFPDEIYDVNGKKITQSQLTRGNMVLIY